MDDRTGRIHEGHSIEEIAARLGASRRHLHEVLREEMTDKQAAEGSVSLSDHRSVLGRRLGKARNKPCPCGSGKKLKRCCGAPGAVQ